MDFEKADDILRSDFGDGYPVGLAKNGDRSFVCSSNSDDGGITVCEFEDTPEFWTKVEEDAKKIEQEDEYADAREALSQAIDNHVTPLVSTAFWG